MSLLMYVISADNSRLEVKISFKNIKVEQSNASRIQWSTPDLDKKENAM